MNKYIRKLSICVIVAAILCGIVGCGSTDDNIEPSLTNESDVETTEKNLSNKEDVNVRDIDSLLDMTFGEIEEDGYTLVYSHMYGGGWPVYNISEYDGVSLVFEESYSETQKESLTNIVPGQVEIINSDIIIKPGLYVTMTGEEAKKVITSWDEVYMSSENSLYYTSHTEGSQKITAAWAIPEETFEEWSRNLSDDDDYYAEFKEMIQPYKSDPVGEIVSITIKRANE